MTIRSDSNPTCLDGNLSQTEFSYCHGGIGDHYDNTKFTRSSSDQHKLLLRKGLVALSTKCHKTSSINT